MTESTDAVTEETTEEVTEAPPEEVTEAPAEAAPTEEAPTEEVTEAPAEAAPTEEAPTETAATEAAPAREPVIIDRAIQTVGRRKEAVVRVRLVPGTGKFHLDGRTLETYFPNKVHQQLIKAPLVTVDRVDAFDIHAHLDGGGPSGQAGALRLAIARALIIVQPEDRPALKKAGFLTRDPRAIERKKYGLKKARKAPQYSKR
ncbi:MAG: small subunit ribosomal protein [Mycobacterium sp.]|nr:small subunit ribosomal protein [Mycobacterium sp.]